MKQSTYQKFKRYIRRTYKNKICALALIIVGMGPIYLENDATFMVVALLFGIPLFFSKENHVM